MQYLIIGSDGPGFTEPEEAIEVLEQGIIPTFEMIEQLRADGSIIAGGLPVGEREFIFIIEATSNEAVDDMLRELPAWGAFEWDVTPLQSFERRAVKEQEMLTKIKGW